MTPGQYVISAQPVDALGCGSGRNIFFQGVRGGGPAVARGPSALNSVSAELPELRYGGPAALRRIFPALLRLPPPPPPPPPANPQGIDDSTLSIPVYYPGTTDVTAASPVDLRAGGNVGGINLTVVEMRPVRIRGQVMNGGRPAAGAQVSIYQRSKHRRLDHPQRAGEQRHRRIRVSQYRAWRLRARRDNQRCGSRCVDCRHTHSGMLQDSLQQMLAEGRVPGAPTMASSRPGGCSQRGRRRSLSIARERIQRPGQGQSRRESAR